MTHNTVTLYRGRFAPTPSGPLHFGSLFAAVISFLDAKSHNGQWLLRIEDIDPPREQLGAATSILKTLEAHGLYWDENETYQSQNSERYQADLDYLMSQQRLFWCSCSRKELKQHPIYPGTCLQQTTAKADCAIRFHVSQGIDSYTDIFQGPVSCNLNQQYGDVILRRKDDLYAYQLAVVSDDIAQNITHIIRGIDLIDSVFWQRDIRSALNGASVEHGHFAVIKFAAQGQKLSKQNQAQAVTNQCPQKNLEAVFKLINISVDNDKPEHMLTQAINQWNRSELISQHWLQMPFI